MSSRLGPYRYDKTRASDPGGLTNVRNILQISMISADGIDIRDFVDPYYAYQPFWYKPYGYPWIKLYCSDDVYSYSFLSFEPVVDQFGSSVDVGGYPDAGPDTEAFFSWWDPAGECPIFDVNKIDLDMKPAMSLRTQSVEQGGSFVPASDGLPPCMNTYIDSGGTTRQLWAEPQGLGQVVSVIDYSVVPPVPRLYACTDIEFLADDPKVNSNPSEPREVGSITWKPVDLNFPKIDTRTGKTYDQFLGLYDGKGTPEELTTS